MIKEDEHHVPRVIDKKKRHRDGFTEEVQDKRAVRISFKNYLRQVEESTLEETSSKEWIVERGIPDYDDVMWHEVSAHPTEDEADEAADACRDKEHADDIEYRVREV